MIITCPNCEKKFKIDNSLIPEEGRDLQCGVCEHVWFYKIEKENSALKLNDELDDKENDEQIIQEENNQNKTPKQTAVLKNKEPKIDKILEKEPETTLLIKKEKKQSKFFSYLIVFIISLIGFIVLIDTLKTPLINIFPIVEILLFNLYETLQDIKLFIIDLF